MGFFDLIAFKTIEESQRKLDLFDVWQNGCPNRGLEGRSPAEAYGRLGLHHLWGYVSRFYLNRLLHVSPGVLHNHSLHYPRPLSCG